MLIYFFQLSSITCVEDTFIWLLTGLGEGRNKVVDHVSYFVVIFMKNSPNISYIHLY